MSDIDPDAFGILCRNLIENALRHGADTEPVDVWLSQDATLGVSNAGPIVADYKLPGLAARFERARIDTTGSGLGLAIVAATSERIGSPLILNSPRKDWQDGFEARHASRRHVGSLNWP